VEGSMIQKLKEWLERLVFVCAGPFVGRVG
jgi:hypothetical protein